MNKIEEIKANFSIEWEYKAFDTVKELLLNEWKVDINLCNKLSEINNKTLRKEIAQGNIQLRFPPCPENKDFENLIYNILSKIILIEPILFRIHVHNSILPEDFITRKWIRDCITIPEGALSFYDDFTTHINLFKDSELTKDIKLWDGKSVKGIPISLFLVGQIIKDIISNFRHYRLIDEVKATGAEETIEELRHNRIYNTDEGKVYNYTPLFRSIHGKNELILDVFTEDDFKHKYEWIVDDVLCSFIKYNDDARRDVFFGNDINKSEFKFLVRYKDKSEEIPMQLLPKHKNSINKEATKYIFTKKVTQSNGSEDMRWKEDEKQEARLGLLQGALTWANNEGASTDWLSKNIMWQLGNAFDKLSTEVSRSKRLEEHISDTNTDKHFQEKLLKESFDSLGGSLDELLVTEDKDSVETNKDKIAGNTPDSIDRVALSELLQKEPKLKNILEKQRKGIALNSSERKTYQRIIEKHQETHKK